MNYMENLFCNWITYLGLQKYCDEFFSAVLFSLSVYALKLFGKYVWPMIKNFAIGFSEGVKFKISQQEILRVYVHKEYVSSNISIKSIHGMLFITIKCIKLLIAFITLLLVGLIIYFFIYKSNIVIYVTAYFVLGKLGEAISWLDFDYSKKDIKEFPDELVEKYNKFIKTEKLNDLNGQPEN